MARTGTSQGDRIRQDRLSGDWNKARSGCGKWRGGECKEENRRTGQGSSYIGPAGAGEGGNVTCKAISFSRRRTGREVVRAGSGLY